MIAMPKLLTANEMARHLRVPVRWLKREAEGGRLPHLKADGVLLFRPDVVEAELAKRAAQTPVAITETQP